MWKSVCRLVEILVGPVLLAVLLEIYKIVIMRTWTSRLSSIYGERWNSSHIPLPIYFWYICWLSSVGSAPWNILICNYAHRKMSNSYQNDQGSWPIFVRAWMVRLVSRSIFVCLLWLLFMTCHGRWWLSFLKGGGGFYTYTIAYKLLKIILSFYIHLFCAKQNDDDIAYSGIVSEQLEETKNDYQKAQTEEGHAIQWPLEKGGKD